MFSVLCRLSATFYCTTWREGDAEPGRPISHLTDSAARLVGIHDHMQQQSFNLHLSARCHAVRVPY